MQHALGFRRTNKKLLNKCFFFTNDREYYVCCCTMTSCYSQNSRILVRRFKYGRDTTKSLWDIFYIDV